MSQDLKALSETLKKYVADAKSKGIKEDKSNLTASISSEVIKVFQPVLQQIADNAKLSKEEIKAIAEGIASRISIPDFPDVKVPEAKVTVSIPEIKVPTPQVNYTPPAINVPEIRMPKEMDIKGWVSLMGVDLNNPLPVQLRDSQGNPVSLDFSKINIAGGSGGGGFHHVVIDDILAGTGLTISTSPAVQVSGAVDSVNVTQIGGNNVVVGTGYQDNALRVVNATDATTSVNVVNTNTLDVQLVSGSTASVNITQIGGNPIVVGTGYQDNALRVVLATDAVSSVAAAQVGTWNIGTVTTVTGVTNSVAAVITDSTGIQYSGSNPIPINLVSQSLASSASSIVDSTGVGYSGSNPVPITVVSGALTSTISVGPSAEGAADDGSAPVQIGGLARTTNPTKISDGQVVKSSHDALGRQLFRPIQVRELLLTAYTTVSTGTETTVLTAAAGTYLDCIWMAFANTSGASSNIDIRAVSGGNIIHTIVVPASGTAGWAPPVPWPQDATGNAWTVDGPDVTNSTVYVTSLFTKES